jgi:hypothetical protein
MDREVALATVQRSGSVLCLGVPEGTEVGLDTELWVVGPRFKGIKMIPPNQAHFFYYRCPPPTNSLAHPTRTHAGTMPMPLCRTHQCAVFVLSTVLATTVAWVVGRLRAVVADSSTCDQQR